MTLDRKYIKISPSILAGDFGFFAEEAVRAEKAGADILHLDVMDGHFVKNISFGPQTVAAINRATDMFLDVHLMIYNPMDYIERFVEAGADRITFHIEATEDVEDIINYIKKCNVKVGLALCPETSATIALKYLDKIDLLLLMTVHPGFGGQAFLPEVLEKIKFIRESTDRLQICEGGRVAEKGELPPFQIQVDGGINFETGQQCIEAGANDLVAGTYLYKAENMAKNIEALRSGVNH